MFVISCYQTGQIQKSYPVFGIRKHNDVKEYILATHGFFLNFYSVDQFELLDFRESGFWNLFRDNDSELKIFPEWMETYFYENLENDAPRETQLVQLYKDFMMREFSQENYLSAINLDYENWCQCPKCERVFEIHSYFGIVKCPNCFLEQNNPFESHEKLYTSDEVLLPLKNLHGYANAFYFTETKKYYRLPPYSVMRNGELLWMGDEIKNENE